jgi:hypothetical protein
MQTFSGLHIDADFQYAGRHIVWMGVWKKDIFRIHKEKKAF